MMKAKDTDKARNYCMKEDTRIAGPWEFGKYVRTNKSWSNRDIKNDIEMFRDAIKAGKSEAYLWNYFPAQMAKFPRMFAALHKPPKVREPPEVILLYGPTGTGKTHWFFAKSNESWYSTPVSNGTLWLDGYQGEDWVLFDDFSGQIALVQLLRMLDRYPISLPVKGAHVDFSPANKICITTNIHPRMWYKWKGRENQYPALARRFTKVYEFNESIGDDPVECEATCLGEDRRLRLGEFFQRGIDDDDRQYSDRESTGRSEFVSGDFYG